MSISELSGHICGDRLHWYVCQLPLGHDGQHVGLVGFAGKVIRWDDDCPSRSSAVAPRDETP